MGNIMGMRGAPTELRFLSKVKKMESGCHEWQSTLSRGGYGKFWFQGSQVPAHRMAYKLFVGGIEGKFVLHKCDNRRCVNTEHLFLGNCQDNISDMDMKGRRGTRALLTESQANEIKALLNERYSQEYVAKLYNVDQTTISRIKLGKTKLFKT